MKPPRYPWLLPADHPLYQPWLGFSRPVSAAQARRGLDRIARRFRRELAAYVT